MKMNGPNLKAELLAIQSLADLMQRADQCRALYEEAGMALPEPLKRFLGQIDNGSNEGESTHVVIPGPRRTRPPEAGPDWISINPQSASTQILTLAVLRGTQAPIRARELTLKVKQILPEVSSGSIANIGTRLDGDEIERTEEGWVLRFPEHAGILFDGYLWGPPAVFSPVELAAHRREGILHLLSLSPAGLQATQMEEQLLRCPWLKAPVNKDTLKADIEDLVKAGKIRRRGASKKWELSPQRNEPSAGDVKQRSQEGGAT